MLNNSQVANLRIAFANNSLSDIKLWKTQLSKIKQSGRFPGRLLHSLLKTGQPSIKNVIKASAKSVLIPLGLTAAAASLADAGIHEIILGSGTTTLITSNDEVEDIMKIVKSLEDFCLLLKGVNEAIQNVTKEQKGGFLSMLLGTLDTSLLGNILAGRGINRAGEGIIRAGYGSKRSLFKDF